MQCSYNSGFLQSLVGAALADCFHGASREGQRHVLTQLRHVYFVLLEVCFAAQFPARVELGSAGSIGIPASHEARFPGNGAFLCHSGGTISRRLHFFQVCRDGAALPCGAVSMLVLVGFFYAVNSEVRLKELPQ